MNPKTYVLIGTGARGLGMFARPMLAAKDSNSRLVALCDHNPLRLRAANALLNAKLPVFTDFAHMMQQVNPDGLIIATRDDTHASYAVAGLRAGKRVYCEKPLCVNLEQIHQIRAAAADSTAQGFVTHNARYNPDRQLIKQLIASGCIGDIQWAEYRQNLDFDHGADYFRRWHKHKRHSGGLTVHKGTHHFDFLNWIIGSRVKRLRAEGGSYFYGKSGPFRSERCRGCQHASQCRFHLKLEDNAQLRALYADAERADGYLRDACLFDPTIDVEDLVSAHLLYENGVRVNYSLCAFSSYEGNHVTFQGTKGRLEYTESYVHHAPPQDVPDGLTYQRQMVIYDFWRGTAEKMELPERRGEGHGGADPLLRHDFFEQAWDAPRPDRMASLEEATQAVAIGLATNLSMSRGGEHVDVQALLESPIAGTLAAQASP